MQKQSEPFLEGCRNAKSTRKSAERSSLMKKNDVWFCSDKTVEKLLNDEHVLAEDIALLQEHIMSLIEHGDELIGRKVKMVYTSDAYTDVVPGDVGVVSHVDDAGTVFVNWENGSGLGLIPGIDSFDVIS